MASTADDAGYLKDVGAVAKMLEAKAVRKKAMGIVGPIDTTTGQRAAIESAARRIDQMNRAAQNAVPLPPRTPGFRH